MWFRAWAADAEDVRVLRAARTLGVERFAALGVLTAIRCWAVQHAPDGDLADIGAEDLAWALRWDGDPERLYAVVPIALDGWEDRAEGYRRAEAARERRSRTRAPAKKRRQPATARQPDPPTLEPPVQPSEPTTTPPSAKTRAVAVREPPPHPSPVAAPIVERRPLGGALRAWSSDGRPLIACAGEPSEVLQWDYLCASIGPDALVGWLLSSDAERRLARVHPGSLHRAIEQGIARARPPTIADRLATDASLATDPRQQAALAGASALCAAVGRIEERRARQIAAELAAADVEGGALTADEVLGGIRAYASERAVLRRSARDGQIDPPEAFDVVHAVKRFARDERAKSAPVPKPEAPRAQPALQLLGPAPVEYEDGQDEAAALAIRRANGLERTEEDHARGLESVRSVLRSLGRAGA
jgi:hypothetical protein